MEERAKERGRGVKGEREKEGERRGAEEGGGCDAFINKKQLCMMLTAGWSAPRPNPAWLLLTFQRLGAYPRRRAQSSLSRSSSVQGSGGGRPWLSLLPVLRNTLNERRLPVDTVCAGLHWPWLIGIAAFQGQQVSGPNCTYVSVEVSVSGFK